MIWNRTDTIAAVAMVILGIAAFFAADAWLRGRR